MLRVSDKAGAQEFYKLRVIVIGREALQTGLIEQFLGRTGDLHVEADPVCAVEEVLSGEQLLEQAAERPDVGCPGGAYLLAAVVVVGLLLEVDGEGQHLW